MRQILCFGDSNTFGYTPDGDRYPRDVRWTGALQKLLGEDYYVIEEGMGGRTTVLDDPYEPDRNGLRFLPAALQSHKPLDLVIICLGTNDCKSHFAANPEMTARGVEMLGETVEAFFFTEKKKAPRILILSPVPMGEDLEKCPFASYNRESIEKSKALAGYYEQVAKSHGWLFFDLAEVGKAGSDQLHMDAESHKRAAEALEKLITENL